MTAFRVGLTGGLASGKSTVAELLRDAGFEVVDADRWVAELYAPGEPGARAVAELFGAGFLEGSGAVDKAKVADLVFTDDASRRRLEAVIHPLVRSRFRELAERAVKPVVLEATRLVEAGYAPDFDLIVTVEAPEALRLERAMARGLSRSEALARLEAQGDGKLRRLAAQRTIRNDGNLAVLEDAVSKLVAEIRGRELSR